MITTTVNTYPTTAPVNLRAPRLMTSIMHHTRTSQAVTKLRKLLAKEKRRQRKVAHTLAQLREQVATLEAELQSSLVREKRLMAQLAAVKGRLA